MRFLAFFLAALLLLQTFSRELLVVDYQLHKERITRLFCINKDKPALHCNGQCHLAKQLRKAADTESKNPAAGLAKMKYEVLLPLPFRLIAPTAGWPTPPRYTPSVATFYALAPARGVFRPPTFRA